MDVTLREDLLNAFAHQFKAWSDSSMLADLAAGVLADPVHLRAILDATGADIREGWACPVCERVGFAHGCSCTSTDMARQKYGVFVVRPGAAAKETTE